MHGVRHFFLTPIAKRPRPYYHRRWPPEDAVQLAGEVEGR
jgi:hypothetical protein